MNATDLDQALEQTHTHPSPAPSPVQPMGAGIEQAVEDCALSLARQHRLIDEQGRLHCWNCRRVIDWHVSLHCAPCRAEERSSRPERLRREREAQLQRQQSEAEQSRPVQRVGGRSFRDGY